MAKKEYERRTERMAISVPPSMMKWLDRNAGANGHWATSAYAYQLLAERIEQVKQS